MPRYRRRQSRPHCPYVVLKRLDDPTKQQLKRGIHLADPGRAESMRRVLASEQFQQLNDLFGAELALHQREFRRYMAAGDTGNTRTR